MKYLLSFVLLLTCSFSHADSLNLFSGNPIKGISNEYGIDIQHSFSPLFSFGASLSDSNFSGQDLVKLELLPKVNYKLETGINLWGGVGIGGALNVTNQVISPKLGFDVPVYESLTLGYQVADDFLSNGVENHYFSQALRLGVTF